MIRLPRGVQKGCGGGGGGDGGGVNTGAGMSADTKLFTGFPRVSSIRTLPCPKGTSYQVWHTPMSHWMPRNGNPWPGHQLCGCGENVSAWAGPVDNPNRTAAPPDRSAPAMPFLVERWCDMASRPFGLVLRISMGLHRVRCLSSWLLGPLHEGQCATDPNYRDRVQANQAARQCKSLPKGQPAIMASPNT